MTKRKAGILPKVEFLIIGVFFISFLAWTIPKCSSRIVHEDSEPAENALTSNPVDTVVALIPVRADTLVTTNPILTPSSVIANDYSSLYITINNLKMRRSPELKADVIAELSLFSKVFFMNEVTDSLYEINLGYEVAKEPWVKVRTKKGKEGWVYGAGVNYYKKKRSGVMD
ncbi:MAG: hypothetical protein ACI9XO_004797 [Paraglaciecola sp.]|jgi:hypothetical protein